MLFGWPDFEDSQRQPLIFMLLFEIFAILMSIIILYNFQNKKVAPVLLITIQVINLVQIYLFIQHDLSSVGFLLTFPFGGAKPLNCIVAQAMIVQAVI